MAADPEQAADELRVARAELANVLRQLGESRRRTTELEKELDRTRVQLLESWQHQRDLRASASWRVTRPLRRLARWVRR